MLNERNSLKVNCFINSLIECLYQISDSLLEGSKAFRKKRVSKIHFHVMENTLGSLKCDLDFTDVLLGCTYDPLIKSSLFLVYELLCEVLLYSFELFIFLCDIVTEHVYGNFEIHQTQLSIHFPIIYSQRRK